MEIEKRARLKDKDALLKKLVALGAQFEGRKEQLDAYFGSPELYRKIGYTFLARVRRSGGSCFLTVKTDKPRKDGVWEEFESEVENLDACALMLGAMGLEKAIEVRKIRETYRLGGFEINIDDFPQHGLFVEVEMVSDSTDAGALEQFMLSLGIEKKDIVHIGYITMFLKEAHSPFAKLITH